MTLGQAYFLIIVAAIGFVFSGKGFFESHFRKNAFGTVHSGPFGMYVWGDAAVLGIFWGITALFTLLVSDWILFLLVFSIFWVVRSFGEMIYWFNEQHASKKRVNIKSKMLYKYFHNDSVLFIYQLVQQCILVVSIVASIYFSHIWLKQF